MCKVKSDNFTVNDVIVYNWTYPGPPNTKPISVFHKVDTKGDSKAESRPKGTSKLLLNPKWQ